VTAQEGLPAADGRYRLGGDEFLVAMPRASCELAAVRAEQWRVAFEGLRVPCGDESVGATLSIGIAVLEPGTRDVDGALKEADAALYQSKAEGRNRVSLSRRACS
jgi:diguanylate cyclase (GGDEF)-like protein